MPVRKALVPVDGSEVASKAAKLAARFAAKHGWEAVLLYVLEHPPMPGFAFRSDVKEAALRELRKEGRRILREAGKLFAAADVTVTHKLVEGSAAEMIAAEVETGGYGIIALGSTGLGRGRLGLLLLGSVAEQVIRAVKVPILLVTEATELD